MLSNMNIDILLPTNSVLIYTLVTHSEPIIGDAFSVLHS